jgi:hypothetical protein
MEKYLRLYAEPETRAFEGSPEPLLKRNKWSNVLVIPACNETGGFLRPPPPCAGHSLLILVINEAVSAPEHVSERNRALAATVQTRFEKQWQSAPELGLNLFRDPLAARDVLLVDRYSDGRQLPRKGGVGHARKIGVDLAASLVHQGYLSSSWIHCSDADVQLPGTYFSCSDEFDPVRSGHSALIYPFYHCDSPGHAENSDVILATQLYELSLRYYVAGMKFAGSPYAFHTIGSTMAVSADHYAKVRGFPKRAAGEDFYLLNKLAKVGDVHELVAGPGCRPIEIESRRSNRVPFGTGAAVNRIADLEDPVTEFRFYNPSVFVLLQHWLQSLSAIWKSQSADISQSIFPVQPDNPERVGDRRALSAGLREIGTQQALEHAFRQSRDLDQFSRQMHTWFDAFRTLKLIHTLRDNDLPNVSYASLAANPTFCALLQRDSDLAAFSRRLRQRLLK